MPSAFSSTALDPLVPLPGGLAADQVTAVAPFTSKPDELMTRAWRNRRDGQPIEVTTRPGGERGMVR